MPEYHPEGWAWQYPELARRVASEAYRQALAAARREGPSVKLPPCAR